MKILASLLLAVSVAASPAAAQDTIPPEPSTEADVPVVEHIVVDTAEIQAQEANAQALAEAAAVPIPTNSPGQPRIPLPPVPIPPSSQALPSATVPATVPVPSTLPPTSRGLATPGAPTNAPRFTLPRPGGGRPIGPNLPPIGGVVPAPTNANSAMNRPGAALGAGVAADDSDSTDVINFKNMPLEQFLDEYATISRRTVLRAANLPTQSQINFKPSSPLTADERLQMYDTILALNGITMIPTGEKAVLAVPTAQAMQEGAAFANKKVEDYAEASQFVTHVIKVEHIPVQEAAETLKQFAKNQNGIVALETTKTLILRDYAINVKRMLEVLKRVDIEIEQEYQFEVFPVKFGKVEDLYQTLSSVVSGGGGGATPAVGGRTGARSGGLGGGLGGNGGFGNSSRSSGLGSSYNNRSSGQYYGQSEGMEPLLPQQQAVTRAPGTTTGTGTFGSRLNSVNRAGGVGQNPNQPVSPDASITPDPRSNSLIVYANRKDMAQLRKIIEKVDTLLAQVMIEAVIMEVALTSGLNYGVTAIQKYNQYNPNLGGGGAMDNLGTGNTLTNLFPTIPTGGGLNYLLRFNDNINVVVQALASDGNINVLQRPRIITSHATAATFVAGQVVPFLQGGFNNGISVGTTQFYERQQVGVSLDVLPYITPDGLVVMEVEQTIENLAPNNAGVDTVANAPVTNKRSASSTISVRSGDSVLLGGFIQAQKGTTRSGVPLLKDIPLLGALFRNTQVDKSRTELMILMSPTVLPTPQSASELSNELKQGSPQIRMMEQDFSKERAKLNKKASRQVDADQPASQSPDSQTNPPTPE